MDKDRFTQEPVALHTQPLNGHSQNKKPDTWKQDLMTTYKGGVEILRFEQDQNKGDV